MLTLRSAQLLRRFVLMLGMYSLLRLLFLIWNHRLLSSVSFGRVAQAFVYGLRFDLSALVAINFPFILLSLLPPQSEPKPIYERFLKALFLISNTPFLIINVIDLEFFQFTGRRCTWQSLRLAGDPGVKWGTMVISYWPLLLLGLFLIASLFLLYGKTPGSSRLGGKPAEEGGRDISASQADRGDACLTGSRAKPFNLWLWAANLILIFPVGIILFRGGLQWRPIGPAVAMGLNHSGLAELALNSSFTVLKSYRNKAVVRRQYFSNRDELLQYVRALANQGERQLPDEKLRDNIVILILESFSAEYWGAGNGGNRYTPFLDSLASQSLFFEHHYANGRSSIEVMPPVLAGLPSLMSEPFIDSAYQSNELLGLGTLLARQGYTTSFFHGGKNGTMRFDEFMHLAGLQRYVGLNEYPYRQDYDGTWGIYDEPFLQFTADQLSKQPQPFLTAIFTLSSHHPYHIPDKYRGRFKKGTLPVHESIGYTDYAVEQFFATARRQPWYTNTLFIITADHTQKLETPQYLNTLGQYRVPLLLFHPGRKLPKSDPDRTTQHADIFASVLDYLHIEPERRLLFGQSVFRSGPGRAFLQVQGHNWLIRGHQAIEFVPEGTGGGWFDLARDPQLKSPLAGDSEERRELEKEAKALLQYHNNGMLDNNLYDRTIKINENSER